MNKLSALAKYAIFNQETKKTTHALRLNVFLLVDGSLMTFNILNMIELNSSAIVL